MNDWNNDLSNEREDREMCDHDFEREPEEETPDILVMMGISETPMKDKLTELFQCFNPKNNQI